jgi:hypothetical protein
MARVNLLLSLKTLLLLLSKCQVVRKREALSRWHFMLDLGLLKTFEKHLGEL